MLLGELPPNVLLHVLQQAAYPLSTWRPLPDRGQV